MATYVNDLRLTELATGEGSGTWGVTTNTNLELIGEALGYGTQDCFATDADATTTVADGATDPARAMYFKVTSSATLTATRTLTIAPNTMTRVMLIENATTGSQSIAISQGSGGNVTIASGQVKMVYLDGAGAGAAVVDAMASLELGTITVANLTATTADINGGTIDGATIGGASAAAGTFTTLNATGGGSLTGTWSDLGTVTTVDINGGTIDGVVIGGASAAAGTFTNLTASGTVSFSGATVSNGGSVTTIDINGGTIDGTTIGGASAGAGTFTNLTATGTTTLAGASTTADITFGDNDKAIFGAGSDLEIYSDGAQSFIQENGPGALYIQGTHLYLNNAAGTSSYITAVDGGDVTLFGGGSAKLATTATGIDVTGTVTADGLTVDTATGSASPTPSKVTIATSTSASDWSTTLPWGRLSFYSADASAGGAKEEVTLDVIAAQAAGGVSDFRINTYNSGAKERFRISYDGDISFYEDTGTTPKFFWDASAEQLQLTAPVDSPALSIKAAYGTAQERYGAIKFENTSYAGANSEIRNIANGASYVGSALGFFTSEHGSGTLTQRMTIDRYGNVGVGVTSPSSLLNISAASPVFRISNTGTTGDGLIHFGDSASNFSGVIQYNHTSDYMALYTSALERMRIDSSGNLGLGVVPGSYDSGYRALQIGTTANFMGTVSGDGNWISNNAIFSAGAWKYIQTASASSLDMQSSTAPFRFRYAASGTAGTAISWSEAMRLDASGNLLLGGTGTPTSSAGNLVLYNGTAPTGNATNGVILYAEDVSASSELKVRDEAGNVTTLSPHNFDLIPEGPSEDMAWSYYSERDGKRINVDMLKAIRLLEQLSGEKLVHMV